ncbi:MAG: phosphoribosyltransferase family protein [Bacteroidota bacterium]|jgi:pyrimidine operon attenuation protein/uracil phosphoribosyltransferase
MEKTKTLLLNKTQIAQRIDRIAYQIYEDNAAGSSELVMIGIHGNGYTLAERLHQKLSEICQLQTKLVRLRINKNIPVGNEVELSCDIQELAGKSIVLVDDVLNSGKTLIYSLKAILKADTLKIRTVLMVDRDHRRYPIMADFVGMTLSTTFQEHVSLEFGEEEGAYLS